MHVRLRVRGCRQRRRNVRGVLHGRLPVARGRRRRVKRFWLDAFSVAGWAIALAGLVYWLSDPWFKGYVAGKRMRVTNDPAQRGGA